VSFDKEKPLEVKITKGTFIEFINENSQCETYVFDKADCPHCGKEIYNEECFTHLLDLNVSYCPFCGKKIYWNSNDEKSLQCKEVLS
jgi:endogenous inhibitor of DNA gyrase (YacG/DUF329 family)